MEGKRPDVYIVNRDLSDQNDGTNGGGNEGSPEPLKPSFPESAVVDKQYSDKKYIQEVLNVSHLQLPMALPAQNDPSNIQRSKSAGWADKLDYASFLSNNKSKLSANMVAPAYSDQCDVTMYAEYTEEIVRERKRLKCMFAVTSVVVFLMLAVFFGGNIYSLVAPQRPSYHSMNRVHSQGFLLIVIMLLMWRINSTYRRIKMCDFILEQQQARDAFNEYRGVAPLASVVAN
ncbi:hypothetical protein HDE_06259 [Halotydeus destructor]|nr:hypothetical protein HDE_06259 [Halotydeus destructor]